MFHQSVKGSGLNALSKDYKKDIFSILAVRVEPSHETRQLQRTRRTTPLTRHFGRQKEIRRGGQIVKLFRCSLLFYTFLIFLSSLNLKTDSTKPHKYMVYNKNTIGVQTLRVQIPMAFSIKLNFGILTMFIL